MVNFKETIMFSLKFWLKSDRIQIQKIVIINNMTNYFKRKETSNKITLILKPNNGS